MHLLLVHPVVLSGLPALDLALLEPKSNLFLGGLDGIRAVADVATDVLRRWYVSGGDAGRAIFRHTMA